MRKSTMHALAEKEAVPLQKYYRARCEVSAQGQAFLDAIQHTLPSYIDAIVHAHIPHPGTPKRGITKILTFEKITPETVDIQMQILT